MGYNIPGQGPPRTPPPPAPSNKGFLGNIGQAIGNVGSSVGHAMGAPPPRAPVISSRGNVGASQPHGVAKLGPAPVVSSRGNIGASQPHGTAKLGGPMGSDIQSSGAGYGSAEANAYKQSAGYKLAIVQTFLHQPDPQKALILKGAYNNPSYEGNLIKDFVTMRAGPFGAASLLQKYGVGVKPMSNADLNKASGGGPPLAGLTNALGNVAGGLASAMHFGQKTELQKLTGEIGGATSPQDVLRVGGAALSKGIDAIPVAKMGTPGEAIAAQQAGVVPGGLGKHLLQNAVNLPAEAFPSMAIPVGEAINGHWGQALHTITQPYASALASPKAFHDAVYNNPLNTYLMFAGLAHPTATILDTAQSLARRKGMPNITPESVHLTGSLTHERPNFSRSPITRLGQKNVEFNLYKRADSGKLVPRSENTRQRLIKLEVSRIVGQADRVRSAGHSEQMVAHGNSVLQHKVGQATHYAKTALRYDPKPALIKGADVLALAAQGVIRRPATWADDLQKVIDLVGKNRSALLEKPADLAAHDKFVQTLVNARDHPPDAKGMQRFFDAAATYAKDYKPMQAEAKSFGHYRDMSNDALLRRDVMTAAAVHMPGVRMDPILGMVRDGDKVGAAAEVARLRAKAATLEKQGQRAADGGLNPKAALADTYARIKAVRATDAAPMNTHEMARFVNKETGGRPVAYVQHEVGGDEASHDASHYVSQERTPSVARQGNTLYAFTHGLTNPSHEAMLQARVHLRGVVDAHRSMNRLVQQLVHVPREGQGWNSYHEAKQDLKNTGHVPFRLAQQFHPSDSLSQALESGKVNMATLQDEASHRALDINARLKPSNEPGKYGSIDRAAAKQLQAHENLINPIDFYRGIKNLNSQFRKVALATSFRHLPGVMQEVAIRSAMSGVGPISLLAGKAAFNRAKQLDPVLGRQRQIEHTGGLVTGQALSLTTRTVSRHYEGTLLHGPLSGFEKAMRAPGPRQASTLWHQWMRFTLQGTKHVLENTADTAAFGKHAIQSQGGILGLIGQGMHSWGKMVDQAAHGILDENTARQMGANTRRIYGRWTDLTPGEQAALMFSPFGMWWTNSIAWLARMPVDHPMGAAFQAALNQGTQKQREAMGLDMFAPNHLPLYKQGGIALPGGSLLNMNYYSPMGTMNDPGETLASLIAPWAEPVILALFGKNWLANPITSPGNPKGRTGPKPEDIASVILGSLAASFVPLYQKAQTLVEGGGSKYDTSNLLAPKTKAANPGLMHGLIKDVTPLRLSRASNGAAAATGTGTIQPSGAGTIQPAGSGGGTIQPAGSGGGPGTIEPAGGTGMILPGR